MISKEIVQLEVMQKLDVKQMSQKEAVSILRIDTRQAKRLLRRYREHRARCWSNCPQIYSHHPDSK